MPNLTRVGIVGTGWVGSSVAISTLHAGVAQELLLHDTRTAVAEGEAMDLAHGAAYYPVAAVRAVSLDEMQTTDAVVIAAGRGGRAGESRLDLARDNVRLVREIIPELSQEEREQFERSAEVLRPCDRVPGVIADGASKLA